MDDIGNIIQIILDEVTENVSFKNTEEIIQDLIATDFYSTVLDVERKPSETSEISSGFEDLSNKTAHDDFEMTTSTPKNETPRNEINSCEQFFNDTIDEAFNKFEFGENFKEASTQTSFVGVDRECQCDFIIKKNEQQNKEIKTSEDILDCKNSKWTSGTINHGENIRFERIEVCERVFTFPKHTSRIRVGLPKRARLQS